MGEWSDKTCLVYDYGNSIEMARRLGREMNVLYFRPWKKSAPCSHDLAVGRGYEEITRVRDLFDVLDKVDLAVFPDIHDGDLQLDLERRGIRVWGSRKAERYEYNRVLFKDTLKEVGLPVVPYKVCTGMTELRRYLSKNDNKWIKGDRRGDFETWHHVSYALSQAKLDAMDYYFGPGLKELIRFVVDDNIDTVVEEAYDGYMVTSPDRKPQFPKLGFLGYEDKNQAHILAVTKYSEMNEDLREINERFCPKLALDNARTQWGTEAKKTESETFFLDSTPREPCPPGQIVLEIVDNLPEIFWHGAVGELVEMEANAKFGSQIMLYSSWASSNHQAIYIPEKIRQFVKLFNSYRDEDGIEWIIPHEVSNPLGGGREQIGAVVGTGDTIEESNEAAIEIARQIEGFEVEPQIHSLCECLDRIKKGEDEGIAFAEEVPEPASVLESGE